MLGASTDAISPARKMVCRLFTKYRAGTIAEKGEFTMIPAPAGEDAADYAFKLLNAGDPRVDSKYGPAGCIALGDGKFLFFGWARD